MGLAVDGLGGGWAWPVLLKVKVSLVALLLSVTAVHDFWVGLLVARRNELSDGPAGSPRSMTVRIIPWLGRLVLVVGLVILGLGVAVSRG